MSKQVKVLIIEDDPYIYDLIILYAEKRELTNSSSLAGSDHKKTAWASPGRGKRKIRQMASGSAYKHRRRARLFG
jgi:hypothetical protein